MSPEEIRKLLEQQLQLLAEKSKRSKGRDLAQATEAMLGLAITLEPHLFQKN